MEWSHVAVENTGEHRRMLRMKFYVTSSFHNVMVFLTETSEDLSRGLRDNLNNHVGKQ